MLEEIQPNSLYTVDEACALLRISRATLSRLRHDRELASMRLRRDGRAVRFRGKQILDYLDRCERSGRISRARSSR